MQKYTDVVLSNSGTPIGGATITVTNYPAATPATIYASDGGTAVGSVTTDPTGRFAFYAADGHYSITISGAGLVSQTIDDVVLNDPSNDATSANLAGAGGAGLIGTSDGSTVQAKLTSQASSIATNTSNISTNTSNISSNTTAIAGKVNSADLGATGGAALVGASDGRTVQANLSRANQAQSGNFYSDSGGVIQRMADRLFVGDGVQHDGKATPTTGTWVKSVSSGIYEYLESHATALLPAMKGIGMFSAARSSTGGGTANDAAIGLAGFGYNDYVGGLGGVWGMYSTVLRASGVNGPSHGMEIDIGNLGTTAVSYPNAMNPSGLTDCLWLCTGGETTNNTAVGTASMAIGIFQNDSQATKTAKFDKGIVFHSKALAGTDGATGTGTAIAMATCQLVSWYNNSNGLAGYVYSAVTGGAGQGLLFTDGGLQVRRISDSSVNAAFRSVASAANYVELVSSAAGAGVTVQANGSDANVDLILAAKGTGVVEFGYGSSVATTPSAFSASRRLAIKDANGTIWYIPISTIAW